MHSADLMGGECFAEEINGGHLTAEEPVIIQLRGGTDVALVIRIIGGYRPGHFGGRG